MKSYLTAAEAADRLGVSRQTLYAYVSRGLIRAEAVAGDPQRSRYLASAVEALQLSRRRGRRPKEVARSTLDWGVPALESAISAITGERLSYRGVDAVDLAAHATLERTAALLWDCPEDLAFAGPIGEMMPAYAALLKMLEAYGQAEALPLLLSAAALDEDTAMWRKGRPDFAVDCGRLVRQLFAAACAGPVSTVPLHLQLAHRWSLGESQADLLRMALVLCADHEMNVSTFTARCIASAGASLKAAVVGALQALSGSRHGGATTRVENFCDGLAPGDVARVLKARLAAGEEVPGIGHPLYPGGDIRARALLDRILPQDPQAADLVAAVEDLTGGRPSIDFALVVLRRHLGLPPGAAFTLFALGRSVGWIAHAREQWQSGQLIRPRATYTGPVPDMRQA